MAQNPIPEQNDKALTLAHDMMDGLHSDGVSAGVKQNTEADFDDRHQGRGTGGGELSGRARRQSRTRPRPDHRRFKWQVFIGSSKRNLQDFLGTTWSTAWKPVGYLDSSLAMPTTVEERQALLQSMAAYYTANPSQENAAKNITAAQAPWPSSTRSKARAKCRRHHEGRRRQESHPRRRLRPVAHPRTRTHQRTRPVA